MADLFDEETGEMLPVNQWLLIWRQGISVGTDITTFKGGDGEGRVTKIRIPDRIKRIELIGKHVNVLAFVVNFKHNIDLEGKTRDEVVGMIKELLKRGGKSRTKTTFWK